MPNRESIHSPGSSDKYFYDLLKISKKFPKSSGINNITYMVFLFQVLTLTGYVYFVIIHPLNVYFFYFFVSMSVLQGVFTAYDMLFFRYFLNSIYNRKLVRRNNSYVLTVGILKLVGGSPLSGIAEILLWSTLAKTWELENQDIMFPDLYRSLSNVSAIILLSAIPVYTLYYPTRLPEEVYIYSLSGIGIICEIFVIKYHDNSKMSVNLSAYSSILFANFYLAVLLIIHFNDFRFYPEWRFLLLLEFSAFCLFDFFILRPNKSNEVFGDLSFAELRNFLGLSVVVFVFIFLALNDIFNAFVYTITSEKFIFPHFDTSLPTLLIFFGISMVVIWGYNILHYVLYYLLPVNNDINKKIEQQLDLEYQPIIRKVMAAYNEYKQVVINYDQTKKENYYTNQRYNSLLKTLNNLKNEQSYRINHEIEKSKEKWFQDGYERAYSELSKKNWEIPIEQIEIATENRLFELLFNVKSAPENKRDRVDAFNKIYKSLTKIYHPDANNGNDTNRIMQKINDYFESLIK